MSIPQDLELKIKELAHNYEQHGYGFIEDFLTPIEIESMRQESLRLVKEDSKKERDRNIFSNMINQTNQYFINSGDKVRFFFEKKSIDESSGQLLVPEEQSLAKIGHALHNLNPIFRNITESDKIREIFKAINFIEPTVMQSMIIFKNPKVGGEYTPHQDASFLCTEPIHLAGIWLALDDSTEENGCLEFIPGSHRCPLGRRLSRKRNQLSGDIELEWDKPPLSYDDNQFVKVPVKKGSLVLIHGLVVHRSSANVSDKARWVYTFHGYDKSKAVYLKDNWLQVENQNGVGSNTEELVQYADQLASEYLNLVQVDLAGSKKKVEESVEECLTHLEEVCSALESHRQNSSDLPNLMKNISDKTQILENLYSRVDAIEKCLADMRELLGKLEASMDELEIHDQPVRGKIRQMWQSLSQGISKNFLSKS